jgi:RNA polymerase sigma-70 factor, ECF subfamily
VTMRDFEAFYVGTAARMLRFACGLTADVVEAQDLTQEAYARAWQRWRRVRRYDSPEAWVRLVVSRLAMDRWRRLGVRTSRPLPRPAPVAPPDEELVVLVAALKRLPFDQRRALALHYLLDRSVADIAAEAGAKENTVKSWLARGRANLAAELGARSHVS